MKRLQFRHHENIFESRQQAIDYFEAIVNTGRTESIDFGGSLYAEPLVAKYLDENNNVQLILGVGVENGNTPYHLIDSADIHEKLTKNAEDIANEVARAIAKDEDLQEQINEISGSVEDNTVEIVSVEPSGANVFEEYALKNKLGQELGEHIKVYKDSALVWVQLGYKDAKLDRNPETGEYDRDDDGNYILHYTEPIDYTTYLYLIYSIETGDLRMVGLNVEQYITESEFAAGLEVNGHIVSVKIDALSEPFLTVSNDGVKLAGVQDAIDVSNSASTEYTDNAVATEKEERLAADSALSESIATALDEAKTYTTENFSAATIHTDEAVSELSGNTVNAISDAVAGAKDYTDTLRISKLALDPSDPYYARYQLDKGDGQPMGVTVDVPKVPQQITNIRVGHIGDVLDPVTGEIIQEGTGSECLEFIYFKQDIQQYVMTSIPFAEIIADYAFADGLAVHDGVVSIEIAPNEEFLWVDPSGIGTSGIGTAIRTAVETSYSTITNETNAKLEQLNNSLGGRIDNNTSAITELHHEVTAVTDDVRNLAEDFVQLHLEYDEIKSGMTEMSACVVSAVTEVREIADKVDELSDKVDSCEDSLSAISASVATVTEQVEINTNNITELSGVVMTLSGDVADLKDVVDGYGERISNVESAITEINNFLNGSGLTNTIYTALKTMLVGTEKEIKVTPDDTQNTVTIGFEDDAIFGEVEP